MVKHYKDVTDTSCVKRISNENIQMKRDSAREVPGSTIIRKLRSCLTSDHATEDTDFDGTESLQDMKGRMAKEWVRLAVERAESLETI